MTKLTANSNFMSLTTTTKISKLERERLKALNDLLVAECKSKNANLDSIKIIISKGADIHYKNSMPLYWAARQHNFGLVKFLISKGALDSCDNARRHISKICDFKWKENVEPAFFEILDLAHSRVGDFMMLFAPYINNIAVNGKLDKIKELQKRYSLTDIEIVNVIEVRVVFEVIINGYVEMLQFIERHKVWIDQKSFDSAVDSGELIVLDYMLSLGHYFTPSDSAVAKAVFDGYFDILDRLIDNGYCFEKKALFLEKACRAAYDKSTDRLEYLLKHGYSLTDTYNNKSIFEHAVEDKNQKLLEYIRTA